MITAWATKESLQYKIACDGYDLLDKFNGTLLNENTAEYAKKFTRVPLFPNIEEFVYDTIQYRKDKNILPRKLTTELCDKYEVGVFNTTYFVDRYQSNFVLFHTGIMNFWLDKGIDLFNIDFMVAVSRNSNNNIDGIGLRVLDTKRVLESFKWLFPFGQNCTFGANLDDGSDVTVCEGFQDMIALRESGYNAIGLGSADITPEHQAKLPANFIWCGDMDNFGLSQRKNIKNYCFYAPEGKDPYEVYLNHGKVELINVA